jgi:hypothetical protein
MEENIMSVIQAINTDAAQRRTIIDIARDLGPVIAQRASETWMKIRAPRIIGCRFVLCESRS